VIRAPSSDTVASALTGPYIVDEEGNMRDVFEDEKEARAQALRHEWIQGSLLNRDISTRIRALLDDATEFDAKDYVMGHSAGIKDSEDGVWGDWLSNLCGVQPNLYNDRCSFRDKCGNMNCNTRQPLDYLDSYVCKLERGLFQASESGASLSEPTDTTNTSAHDTSDQDEGPIRGSRRRGKPKRAGGGFSSAMENSSQFQSMSSSVVAAGASRVSHVPKLKDRIQEKGDHPPQTYEKPLVSALRQSNGKSPLRVTRFAAQHEGKQRQLQLSSATGSTRYASRVSLSTMSTGESTHPSGNRSPRVQKKTANMKGAKEKLRGLTSLFRRRNNTTRNL
jgi:hypothetical protein